MEKEVLQLQLCTFEVYEEAPNGLNSTPRTYQVTNNKVSFLGLLSSVALHCIMCGPYPPCHPWDSGECRLSSVAVNEDENEDDVC